MFLYYKQFLRIKLFFKVVLHDPSEEPLPSLRGFLVGPGLSVSGAIRKSKVAIYYILVSSEIHVVLCFKLL